MSRVGLVGFGAIAENAHVPALRSVGVSIAAVAEPAASRRQAAARSLAGARIYDGLAALLGAEKELDALIVATPPLHHADAVLAGLAAGLPILCEKPLTLDPAALDKIEAESTRRGLAVYTVDNWSYAPQWARLLGEVERGRLGAVRHAEIRVLRTRPSTSALPGDWRKDPAVAGGGILVDHGWHNLYLMRRLLGPRTRLVSAILTPTGSVDETAAVLLSAPAATGTIYLSWRAAERSNHALVVGEKGSAELRDDTLVVKAEGQDETIRFPEKLSAGSAHPEWLAAMWPAFAAECAGKERGVNLAQARFCQEAIREAYGAREHAHA